MQRILLVFGTALLALMAGALFYAARQGYEVKLHDTRDAPQAQAREVDWFPSFTMPDIDGVIHDFSEWNGRHRLVNFWATWCAPCRREIPLLKAFQDEQGEHGIQVIGISLDFPKDVLEYAESAEFNYPVLIGQEQGMVLAESSGVDFIALPFTMIVAADGELLTTHIGELHREDLDHIVNVLAQLDRGDIDKETARVDLMTL
ncbi:MAG: TlpA disulfide reductase family protein [Woeseiaceae bacterium]